MAQSRFNIPQIVMQGMEAGHQAGIQRRQLADIMQRHRETLLEQQLTRQEHQREFGLNYDLRERAFEETVRQHGVGEFSNLLKQYPYGTATGEARPFPVLNGMRIQEQMRPTQPVPMGIVGAAGRRAGFGEQDIDTQLEAQYRSNIERRRRQLEDMRAQLGPQYARVSAMEQRGQRDDSWKQRDALMRRQEQLRGEWVKANAGPEAGGYGWGPEDPRSQSIQQKYDAIEKAIQQFPGLPQMPEVPLYTAPPQPDFPSWEEAEKKEGVWGTISDLARAPTGIDRSFAYGAAGGAALAGGAAALGVGAAPVGAALLGGAALGGMGGKLLGGLSGNIPWGREERVEGWEDYAKRTGRPLTVSGAKQPHLTAPQVKGAEVPAEVPNEDYEAGSARYKELRAMGMSDEEATTQLFLEFLNQGE